MLSNVLINTRQAHIDHVADGESLSLKLYKNTRNHSVSRHIDICLCFSLLIDIILFSFANVMFDNNTINITYQIKGIFLTYDYA